MGGLIENVRLWATLRIGSNPPNGLSWETASEKCVVEAQIQRRPHARIMDLITCSDNSRIQSLGRYASFAPFFSSDFGVRSLFAPARSHFQQVMSGGSLFGLLIEGIQETRAHH